MNKKLLNIVKKAREKDIVVVRSSQTNHGIISTAQEINDRKASLNMAHREKRGMSLSVAIEKVFTKTKRLCRCRLIKTSKTGTASVGVIFGGLGKLGESVTSHLFMNVSITFVMSFGRTGRSRSLLSDSYHMSAFRADTTRASEAKCAVNSVRLLGHILVFNL